MNLAAVLLFAAAVFYIAGEKTLLGIVFFGTAAVFASAAGILQKKNVKDAADSKEGQRKE